MKRVRILSVILVFTLVALMIMTACGKSEKSPQEEQPQQQEQPVQTQQPEKSAEEPEQPAPTTQKDGYELKPGQ